MGIFYTVIARPYDPDFTAPSKELVSCVRCLRKHPGGEATCKSRDKMCRQGDIVKGTKTQSKQRQPSVPLGPFSGDFLFVLTALWLLWIEGSQTVKSDAFPGQILNTIHSLTGDATALVTTCRSTTSRTQT